MGDNYALKYTGRDIDGLLDKINNMNGIESIDNKINIITKDSTDEQYPSAKAVFNLLSQDGMHFKKVGNINECTEPGTIYYLEKKINMLGTITFDKLLDAIILCLDNSVKIVLTEYGLYFSDNPSFFKKIAFFNEIPEKSTTISNNNNNNSDENYITPKGVYNFINQYIPIKDVNVLTDCTEPGCIYKVRRAYNNIIPDNNFIVITSGASRIIISNTVGLWVQSGDLNPQKVVLASEMPKKINEIDILNEYSDDPSAATRGYVTPNAVYQFVKNQCFFKTDKAIINAENSSTLPFVIYNDNTINLPSMLSDQYTFDDKVVSLFIPFGYGYNISDIVELKISGTYPNLSTVYINNKQSADDPDTQDGINFYYLEYLEYHTYIIRALDALNYKVNNGSVLTEAQDYEIIKTLPDSSESAKLTLNIKILKDNLCYIEGKLVLPSINNDNIGNRIEFLDISTNEQGQQEIGALNILGDLFYKIGTTSTIAYGTNTNYCIHPVGTVNPGRLNYIDVLKLDRTNFSSGTPADTAYFSLITSFTER